MMHAFRCPAHQCGVGLTPTNLLVDREGYLPTHLAKRRNVYAWRRAPKIQDLTKVPGRLARDAIHIAMP